MGKILSVVSNPFKNFNLESRAHKIISKAKPTPAPKYEKDQMDLDRLMKEYPEVYQESLKKNEQLDKHLRDVYVTSQDVRTGNIKQGSNPDRPLPVDKRAVVDYLYGVKEPNNIPHGRATLRNVLEFITKHQSKPQIYDAKKIAEEFNLSEETVKSILKFYRVFEVYIPQERQTKAKFAGPSLPKVQVIKQSRKEIPPGDRKSEKT